MVQLEEYMKMKEEFLIFNIFLKEQNGVFSLAWTLFTLTENGEKRILGIFLYRDLAAFFDELLCTALFFTHTQTRVVQQFENLYVQSRVEPFWDQELLLQGGGELLKGENLRY